jgi:hypothetical protein
LAEVKIGTTEPFVKAKQRKDTFTDLQEKYVVKTLESRISQYVDIKLTLW